jgi:very-long-chain (3R)-3-hydroxyacyl-CoA dehydratase
MGKKITAGSLYLVAYNAFCIAGWSYCLWLTYTHWQAGKTATELWVELKDPLTYVQTAAVMEVVHSLVGLVRSPWVTVFMQVLSRVLLVWGYTRRFDVCQADWSLFLMVASWSVAEIPRYAFYVCAQFQESHEIPSLLFFLRYSLFMVLYPTGISGESLQMYAFIKNAVAVAADPVWEKVTYAVAVIYVFGSPYMILNMWGNRKREFKKRREALSKGADSKNK